MTQPDRTAADPDRVSASQAGTAAALGALTWLAGLLAAAALEGALRRTSGARWGRGELLVAALAAGLCLAAAVGWATGGRRLWRDVIARDRGVRLLLAVAWPLVIVGFALRPYLKSLGSVLAGQGRLPFDARSAWLTAPFLGTGAFLGVVCLGVVVAGVARRLRVRA